MNIIPTVGRVMWFYPSTKTGHNNFTSPRAGEPCAAIVAAVNADNMVNLTVFDAGGFPHPRQNVPVVQEDGMKPIYGYYASWMPFQQSQAKKAAAELPPVDNAHVAPGCEQFSYADIKHAEATAAGIPSGYSADQLRAGALDAAIRAHPGSSKENIAEAAQAYLIFLQTGQPDKGPILPA